MPNATDIITAFVLEKLDGEALARRAQIFRALMQVAAPETRSRFESLASECERLDSKHKQLVLDFTREARR